jgi:N,N-dimethylformamidase beta subunit-like, C-terminal
MFSALLVAAAALPLTVLFGQVPQANATRTGASALLQISASNGGRPFAGDRRLLTTISPNGDRIRDRATISIRLSRPATVEFVVAKTARHAKAVHTHRYRLSAGSHTLRWAPSLETPARTYLTFIRVDGRTYGVPNGSPSRVQETPVIRLLGVEAAFRRDSYRPGEVARIRVAADARALTLQIFRTGPERFRTRRNDEMNGVPASRPVRYAWTGRRNGGQTLAIRIGRWPTGMYFARLSTADGRVGFAPFIVRPRRLGEHRVAVVMPTNMWQAYNFHDDDGDGWGETWYAHQGQPSVRLGRPHLDRGVPLRFRSYDLPFLHWLAWNDRPVDYLSQPDISGTSGRALRRAYDLIVFPGHHEYVTSGEFQAVTRYRDLGGNLIFLSANNFFWRVDRRGDRLYRIRQWRDLGRPEASLIGVQYIGNDSGRRGSYLVTDAEATPWLWAGMNVQNGSRIGTFGIEIDKTAPSSPRGTRVVAEIPNLYGRGMTAQMTYYRSRSGARVFAAGAFTLAGSATRSYGGRMLTNLWRHMTADRGSLQLLDASATSRGVPLEAAFVRESYAPRQDAILRLWGAPAKVTVQIFRTGPERTHTRGNREMRGISVSDPAVYPGRQALLLRTGNWPTGMYFARVTAGASIAFAPFVVRPGRLGEHRVAVVLPTLTWQAYNFRDDDGDGSSDTWYADRSRKSLRLARPFRDRGVPMRFRSYDLPFLHWLAWSERPVDYLAQADLERVSSARRLRKAYDLVIFPGHHEYVTSREFRLVTAYRNHGGNLMFLSANNFFWRVERDGRVLRLVGMWRDLGSPEAALVGVQYVAYGSHLRGPYVVRNARGARWLFSGTGLRNGSSFGSFGIEVDRVHPASPRGIRVLAEIRGATPAGQMTYYERAGARVFAAGAFTLGGSATREFGAKLLDNLWRHMTRR